MYNIQRIISLLAKVRKGRLATEEEQALAEWRQEDERHEQLYRKLLGSEVDDGALREMQSVDVETALGKLKVLRKGRRRKSHSIKTPWIAASAAMVLLGGLAFVLYFAQFSSLESDRRAATSTESGVEESIVPGSNRATLTLADGSRIFLDEVTEGAIAEQAGIRVIKTADGEVRYEILSDYVASGSQGTGSHTVTTPPGGQYQIRLPDGSEVWLNAASTLTYPMQFAAAERRVKLEGEGYFEVVRVHDSNSKLRPFIIELPEQTIEVLGTKLNVKSYAEELISKTTLLTGSIRVSTESRSVVLKPGQQAQINRDNLTMGVNRVDIQEIISWKNGYFAFQNEPLENIMNEIGRWYDVEIYYAAPVKHTTFEGSISKFSAINEVLEILELTGGCKFKVEGRRVTVMQ